MKEKIFELLENECYDICEAYEPELVCTLVKNIVGRIERRRNEIGFGPVVATEFGKYIFKVNNSLNGFVSCSNTDTGHTGISNTLYYPYYEDDDNGGLKNLVEMINESWHLCENNY
jgi:hypothetical protein